MRGADAVMGRRPESSGFSYLGQGIGSFSVHRGAPARPPYLSDGCDSARPAQHWREVGMRGADAVTGPRPESESTEGGPGQVSARRRSQCRGTVAALASASTVVNDTIARTVLASASTVVNDTIARTVAALVSACTVVQCRLCGGASVCEHGRRRRSECRLRLHLPAWSYSKPPSKDLPWGVWWGLAKKLIFVIRDGRMVSLQSFAVLPVGMHEHGFERNRMQI
jgi:hypothetical protein